MKRSNLFRLMLAAGLAGAAVQAHAVDVELEIQNLTRGIYFTPILVAAHPFDQQLFRVGDPATTELQSMAEGGDISGLETAAMAYNANIISNPAAGLLAPTMSTSATFSTSESNEYLSIVAMMLPTNDGFIGLDTWEIPKEAGTYTVYLNAYDAGTEANDEIRGGGSPGTPGMPVPPPLEDMIGTGGSGVTSTINNAMVHVHPGNLGDADMMAGQSDIQNTVQRWLNPVAKVTITVTE
ncbi:hypothetical protein FJ444_11440 [Aestuariibacter sp. GS-14]|uniref:spondin domain-containing protein n=1 Tax=Aestuariibacter sp. GS-14 TaxID=2590670 RepID=UPI00112A888D|nr:spondin domain-containing protein [Aestuariibacter sp. GS-14]TPV57776.1 hypothetical protein FJ444_11440 [Aestuariibacter sp. GS-14]